MIRVRPSQERGSADHGWLKALHSFSFADYFDPAHMGFRTLRVINEDRVEPGQGFGTHGHRDMEILTYLLEGELEHKDSMGNGSVIRPGDVQRMSAGTGVRHSEFNHSLKNLVHLLQIWILPEKGGIEPGYEQKTFSESERKNQLRLVASRDARQGSLKIHQDVSIYACLLDPKQNVNLAVSKERGIWIQVARGKIEVLGKQLSAGDGAQIEEEKEISISGLEASEFLLFDLNSTQSVHNSSQ